MKILKIENKIGYFYSFITKNYEEINKIDRDSLLSIVEYILKHNDCSKDDFKEELIDNKAQKIVYKDLDAKLGDLIRNRTSILNEIDSKYENALKEYDSSSIVTASKSEERKND